MTWLDAEGNVDWDGQADEQSQVLGGMVEGMSEMLSEIEGGAIIECALCLEPGVMLAGQFVHRFTSKPQCTYRSYL